MPAKAADTEETLPKISPLYPFLATNARQNRHHLGVGTSSLSTTRAVLIMRDKTVIKWACYNDPHDMGGIFGRNHS
jgi:hypothetical protein